MGLVGSCPPVHEKHRQPAQLSDSGRRRAIYQNAANLNPGRATVRRLNRTEYANAVRDLLRLDEDFAMDMPPDDTGYDFDNIADVLTVSPTLMERYITVAGKIGRPATQLSFFLWINIPDDRLRFVGV